MDDDGYFLEQCKSCKFWKEYYEDDIPKCICTMSNDSGNCLSYEKATQNTRDSSEDKK